MPAAAPLGSPVAHAVSPGAMAAALGRMMSSMSLGSFSAAVGAGSIGPSGPGLGGGSIVSTGSLNVVVNGMPAGRVTDLATCHPGVEVAMGSSSVFVNTLPAARVGDPTTDSAVIIAGSPNFIIGGGSTSAPDFAGADVAAQVAALFSAAVSGKPFCAQCQAAAGG